MGDSPVKKINFDVAGKENALEPTTTTDSELKKPVVEAAKPKEKAAMTIAEQEADEPLLMENPRRYVLFPLQYTEVCLSPTTRHA